MKASLPLSFSLSVAGYHIRLSTANRRLSDYLRKEYAVTKSNSNPLLRLTVGRKDGYFFLSHGHITHQINYQPNEQYSELKFVDFVISSYIAFRLLRKSVLFIHGSSFEKDRGGFVYSGNSGAGKTTVLRGTPKENIYSDDTAVLKKSSAGFLLHPSPFDGRFITPSAAPVPVKRIYLLKQSATDTEKPLNRYVPFMHLLGFEAYTYARVHFMGKESPEWARLCRLIQRLLATTSTHMLMFTKDYRAWEKQQGED